MTRIEDSKEINVAPERVSQYMWDVNNLPNYLPISDVKILERTEDLVRLRHKFTAAGRTMDLVCEQKMLEKNKKMVYRVTKGMKLERTWLLEPTETGTKLTNILEYKLPGWIFGVILDKLKIQKEMRRICTESLRRLKRILEEYPKKEKQKENRKQDLPKEKKKKKSKRRKRRVKKEQKGS